MSNKEKKKRTVFHQEWRVDSNYTRKLSASDKAWLDKFEDEYYRNTIKEDPLHSPEQINDIYDKHNIGWADIVTQTSDEIRDRFKKSKKNLQQAIARVYTPEDYMSRQESFEDALIDIIDSKVNKEE